MRPLHIPLISGLPDDGAAGQWLGRDKYGAVYTLRWMAEKQCFGALGWRATRPRPWPELVLLQGEQEGFIIGHVEGPAISTMPAPGRLSGSGGRVVLTDEIEAAREPARAWTPWLWTVAMLFGLPAAALALVFLAANSPKAGSKSPLTPALKLEAPRHD